MKKTLAVLLVGMLPVSMAMASLFSEDFNSLSAGSIYGQNGWVNIGGSSSMQIGGAVGWDGLGDGNVVKNWATSGSEWIKNPNLGAIAVDSSITMEYDVYLRDASAANSDAVISVGDGTAVYTYAGLWGGKFILRRNGGPTLIAVDGSGNDIVANAQDVYRIKTVWDFQTNRANLAYKNLSNGDTTWTELTSFENGGAPAGSDLWIGSIDESTLTHVMMRSYASAAGIQTEIDNISVIPEPATLGLVALSGLCIYVRRRFLK